MNSLTVHEVTTNVYTLPLAYAMKSYPDEYADAQELGMTDIEFLESLVELGEYGALEHRHHDVQARVVTADE